MKRILIAGFASLAICAPVLAAADHWDRPSCYIYVHEQCFKNGQQLCPDDAYNDALDECDGYYPSVTGEPPKRPLKLKAELKPDPSVVARVRASFKKRMAPTR